MTAQSYDPKLFIKGLSSTYTMLVVPAYYTTTWSVDAYLRGEIMVIDQASYAVTEQGITFRLGFIHVVDQASYAVTTQGITFDYQKGIAIDQASYSITQQGITFKRDLVFTIDQQTYTVADQGITLTPGTLADTLLASGDQQSGTDKIVFSGDQAGGILINYTSYNMVLSSQSYAVSNQPITFLHSGFIAPSGDQQSGSDRIVFSGDQSPGSMKFSNI